MDGWMDGRMDGWMGGWIDGWIGGWMDSWWMKGRTDRWMKTCREADVESNAESRLEPLLIHRMQIKVHSSINSSAIHLAFIFN